ncbi:MAG: tRNA (adenosine(37)-N6)-dimethylallyltransferase MiaA [Bacteroidetes bacterium CG2_30_32_10]|nr:MAG: tRNA (adenosine(37)-N6)-dimethylallyltransferase MiaA [Bacteroidetes bacterium CG2_30_32_10]
MNKMITILGPTATGKTQLAAHVAYKINGEIISADSRQVYKEMNIGTGKDLDDYCINDIHIPYHLIDIAEPGYEYNVFEFKRDFQTAYNSIISRNKVPILCGGTGMYIEAAISDYKFAEVPENKVLREELLKKSKEELIELLANYKKLNNNSDTSDLSRLLRAIEIVTYHSAHPEKLKTQNSIQTKIFGISFPREEIRQRITERLKKRLETGMIDEVKLLITKGISYERLITYGLEYKYISLYLSGSIKYDDMFNLLNIAIHQFAKRQMTWFRRMERNGFDIHWIDGNQNLETKTKEIIHHCSL